MGDVTASQFLFDRAQAGHGHVVYVFLLLTYHDSMTVLRTKDDVDCIHDSVPTY